MTNDKNTIDGSDMVTSKCVASSEISRASKGAIVSGNPSSACSVHPCTSFMITDPKCSVSSKVARACKGADSRNPIKVYSVAPDSLDSVPKIAKNIAGKAIANESVKLKSRAASKIFRVKKKILKGNHFKPHCQIARSHSCPKILDPDMLAF